MQLHEQHVVIVGGSSGIGLATAHAAHRAGASITLIARTEATLRLGAAQLPGAAIAVADVLDETRLAAAFAGLGQVDHVVNTAGTTKLGSLLDPEPVDEQLDALRTRLVGSANVVRAAHRSLRADGSIVFTGGISTDRPVRGAWVSSVGTAAAEQLARALALELAPLRVNAVSPGWTDTPLWERVLGHQRDAVLEGAIGGHLTGRIVDPQHVADAIVLLMANPSITGEIIHVDAGARLT
jgi:NAD(P)-dependent dehydrogenase (short-subunit alcohol dehydrogenase family)